MSTVAGATVLGANPLLASSCIQSLLSPWQVLEQLYSDIPEYSLSGADSARAGTIRRALLSRAAEARNAHLSTLRGVVHGFDNSKSVCLDAEEEDDRGLLTVFEYEDQTLQDVLKYNRHLLDGVDAPAKDGPDRALADVKMRFVVFQLRDALSFLHDRGIACGGFSPSDVLLTETLWVKLGALPLVAGLADVAPVDSSGEELKYHVASLEGEGTLRYYSDVETVSRRSLTDRWCTGDVSNFEYLMALNTAAGRRMVRL